MGLRYKLIALAVVTLGLLFLARQCDRPTVRPTTPGKLGKNETEHITLGNHRVTVIRAGSTVTQFAPGRVDVSVQKNGRVIVRIHEFGITFEPGLGVGYDGLTGKVILDAKLLYYYRLGLNAGIALDFRRDIHFADIAKPEVAVSYVPLTRFPNTSLFLGAELPPVTAIGGVRVSF